MPSTIMLTAVIAVAWVGVAQFARQAELAPACGGGAGGGLGAHSCAHFIVWLNGSSWMFLGLPWLARHFLGSKMKQRDGYGPQPTRSSVVVDMKDTDAVPLPPCPRRLERTQSRWRVWCGAPPPYEFKHLVFFFVVALLTNYAYIAALEFIPASLNTAVFSTTSILTLALSILCLSSTGAAAAGDGSSGSGATGSYARWITAGLSCVGVALISQPWSAFSNNNNTNSSSDGVEATTAADARLLGCCLSLTAAAGTAVYQVTFKKVLGDRLRKPIPLGFFMAKLGLQIFLLGGGILWGLVAAGVYQLQLATLPYSLLAGTAVASLVFNFVIKFGLSMTSPTVVSLATQLGIPLNLLIDLSGVIPGPAGVAGIETTSDLNALSVAGVGLMLVSFSLNTMMDMQRTAAAPSSVEDGDDDGGAGGRESVAVVPPPSPPARAISRR